MPGLFARGFEPHRPVFRICDAFLAGLRASKQAQDAVQQTASAVRLDRWGRENKCANVAAAGLGLDGYSIRRATVWRILRRAGFERIKPTREAWVDTTDEEGRPEVII